MTSTNPQVEEKRVAGNEAFKENRFEDAIKFYSEGIELDPSNHVLYSNRSACYSNLKNWDLCIEDAKKCISLNASFVKGYFRLATAQIELGQLDEANETVTKGLEVQPSNEELKKLIRVIKAKKAAAAARKTSPAIPISNLDQNVIKEINELQTQLKQTSRELTDVQTKLQVCVRDQRRNDLTIKEINSMERPAGLYRAIGKMFLLSSKNEVLDHITRTNENGKKLEQDLMAKKILS